jgi:hypothetical protein
MKSNPGAEPVQRAASSVGSPADHYALAWATGRTFPACGWLPIAAGVLFLIAQVVIWTIDQRLKLDAARDPVFTRRRSSISKSPERRALVQDRHRQEVSTPEPSRHKARAEPAGTCPRPVDPPPSEPTWRA